MMYIQRDPLQALSEEATSPYQALMESVSRQGMNLSEYEDHEKVQQVAQAIVAGDLRSPVLEEHTAPYWALQGVQQKLVSAEDFSTLMIYKGLLIEPMTQKGFSIIPFFNQDKQVSKLANTCLKYLVSIKSDTKTITISRDMACDLVQKMSTKSCMQQQFFWIKNVKDPTVTQGISEAIYRTGFNAFLFLKDEKSNWHRIVPSYGMKQAFLDVCFKENSPKLLPRIGLSTIDDIRLNAVSNTRDEYTYFPGVACPDKADLQPATPINFNHHDFYHATIAGMIPTSHRVLFAKIYDALVQFTAGVENPKAKEILMGLAERVIDMEHVDYKRALLTVDEDSEIKNIVYLFKSLNSLASVTFSRLVQQQSQSDEEAEMVRQEIKESVIDTKILNQMGAHLSVLKEDFLLLSQDFMDILEEYNQIILEQFAMISGLPEEGAEDLLSNTLTFSLYKKLIGEAV
jgi:hypothetical protein